LQTWFLTLLYELFEEIGTVLVANFLIKQHSETTVFPDLKSIEFMCGIVGYVGKASAASVLIDGLRRLEYRGYDSSGLAVMNGSHNIEMCRRSGRLDNLKE